MIAFSDTCSASGSSSVAETLDRLDTIFAGDWASQMDLIAQEIAVLRDDHALLRTFVHGNALAKTWPRLSGAQSFTICSRPAFFARINLWMPYVNTAPDSYRRFLSVDVIHNHYFEFFTTCLLGPGYTSTFWRDPAHHPDRGIGDPVALLQGSEHSLSDAAVWFVEKGADYHSQHWPSDFSVTLNVMPRPRVDEWSVQYVLDDAHRVSSIIASSQ
ncbi:hypothetical protein MOK15_19425 [Sphingobium sp. BYY-5]|uniref:hypothetical protein n=1 Tax=Sphingobium sp. BYY-5 TaxID=2926400 RepID=UPI001FA6F44D|nr:hypothetical protein [Sphingobium sp. BYY-5]MCI4592255.1 hypothetical protein [Sphingobium sp. BYY-5]